MEKAKRDFFRHSIYLIIVSEQREVIELFEFHFLPQLFFDEKSGHSVSTTEYMA